MNAFEIYDQLVVPDHGEGSVRGFSADSLTESVQIAKGSAGQAAILVRGDRRHPPIRTRHLAVDFHVECDVQSAGDSTAERLTIVEFLSHDRVLIKYFLDSVSAAFRTDGVGAISDPVSTIRSLIEIFKSIARPSSMSVQGVWSELLLIACSKNPLVLASSWHATPFDRHDFVAPPQRIEVKSTTKRRREHIFSHDQLSQDGHDSLVVVSVLLESSAGGANIAELVDACVERLSGAGPLRHEFLRLVAESLGEDWAAAERSRYDVGHAVSHLRFFARENVPRLPDPDDDRISSISYSADLTSVEPLGDAGLVEYGGLIEAAVPSFGGEIETAIIDMRAMIDIGAH